MTKIEKVDFYAGFGLSIIALFLYFHKASKQLAKLDKIEELENKLDRMNKHLTEDLVSISLLKQRMDHMESEIKEIKEILRNGEK